MKVLAVHPSPLMYTKIYLRLEPLGLEIVAQAIRNSGHDIRLIDLQVEHHRDYFALLQEWRPDVVAFSCNYLANVPEIVDLARLTKDALPRSFVLVGGHSASFIAAQLLEHGGGAIDCILKGEGEAAVPELLEAIEHDRAAITRVPGVVSPFGAGPAPRFVDSLDTLSPARDLLRHRRKYFIGVLDPCASIEFARGCPWDCSFCSAWTFYGRSYRTISPEKAVEDLGRIREPGVFIVDDVAFIQGKHGLAIGEAIAKKGIKKKYYLETRGDVLLRNKEVFAFWKSLGLEYMFIGLEAIDAEGLLKHRKRISLGKNFEALEFARSLGITVAINLIADPDWDKQRFEVIRQWCLEIPDCKHQRQHAVSRHGNMGDGVAQNSKPRLSAVRYPTCRAAYHTAATRVLRGVGEDPAGLEQETLGLDGTQIDREDCGRTPAARTDEFREDALEVQQRLQSSLTIGRPSSTGEVRNGPAACPSRG